MTGLEKVNCPRCHRAILELVRYCASCGTDVGYPNVNLAQAEDEKQALEARYTEAVVKAEVRGILDQLQLFEIAIKNSCAVVSMSSDRLRSLATNSNELYSNYHLAVRAQSRRPAKVRNDQARSAVDGRLWGVAASEIRYAALSLDGKGLKSYGDCFVTLDEAFIAHRSSVLADNSFVFLKDLTFGEELPTGFRSNWEERHKVAVAESYAVKTGKSWANA